MSVEDIDRRLDDRFALLRGGDRSAPDRHQTLLAVIDWSWNLLTEARVPGAPLALGVPRRVLAGRRQATSSVMTRSTWSSRWSTSRCSPCSTGRARCATGCWRRSASSAGCSWSAPARTARRATPQQAWAAASPTTRARDLWTSRPVRGGATSCAPRRTTSPTCLRCAVAAPDPDAVPVARRPGQLLDRSRGENARVIALRRRPSRTRSRAGSRRRDEVDTAVGGGRVDVS